MDAEDFERFLRFEELGPGLAFEQHLEHLFTLLGFTVERTPQVGDYGADLILTAATERVLVQAKRWSQPLGVAAIQEAAAAKPHYNCTRAIVVTTSFFTEAAKRLAASNSVELWDRQRYLAEARDALRTGTVAPERPTTPVEPLRQAFDRFERASQPALKVLAQSDLDRTLSGGSKSDLPQLREFLRAVANLATAIRDDQSAPVEERVIADARTPLEVLEGELAIGELSLAVRLLFQINILTGRLSDAINKWNSTAKDGLHPANKGNLANFYRMISMATQRVLEFRAQIIADDADHAARGSHIGREVV
jgi:hypothetical protein